MEKWITIRSAAAFAFMLGTSLSVSAATIYGIIQQNNRPVENARVTLTCEEMTTDTKTDNRGAYRFILNRPAKCRLKVQDSEEKVVFFYDEPTRYNFEIKNQGGKTVLNRR